MEHKLLSISKGNDKLKATARYLGLTYNAVVSFSIPAGYTCPAASICQTWFNPDTMKMEWGEHAKVTCFMARVEGYAPAARRAYWTNWEMLKQADEQGGVLAMTDLILRSLAAWPKLQVMRIHAGGDYYNRRYFDAWANVVRERQDVTFFGYTKMLPFLIDALKWDLPNWFMNYSYGGTYDKRRPDSVPTSYIVKSVEDADALDVPVICSNHDNDADYSEDYRMILARRSFALIEH